MSGILKILSGKTVYFLLFVFFIFGVYLELKAAYAYWRIIKESANREKKDSSVKKKGDAIEKSSTVVYSDRYKEDIIRESENPNKFYSMVEQIIPLLPLLGILGTVVGLYNGLIKIDLDTILAGNDLQDMVELFGSMKYALGTTIMGIICAIVLKTIGILFVVPQIETINTKLDILDAQKAQIETIE